ncbi:hypothetical protein GCM10027212_31800 [Actinotalea caeni]
MDAGYAARVARTGVTDDESIGRHPATVSLRISTALRPTRSSPAERAKPRKVEVTSAPRPPPPSSKTPWSKAPMLNPDRAARGALRDDQPCLPGEE